MSTIDDATSSADARAAALAAGAAPVAVVGVVGAGLMGAGIAQGLAQCGLTVLLKDRDAAATARGLAACAARFQDLAERGRLSPAEATAALARIQPVGTYAALGQADLVVEAVFEDLATKRLVLDEIEAVAGERLVFASNTSALPIAAIAQGCRRPERVVGMHFFSPVHRMPLLEVVRPAAAAAEPLATAVAVGRRMGKTVIVVEDGPGFFTTRAVAALSNEAVWLLTEGEPIERIDAAMIAWGWPLGPLALLDEVGLDVAAHAGETTAALGPRMAPPPALARLVAQGHTGRKAGRGFYHHAPGQPRHPNEEVYRLLETPLSPVLTDEEIADRCWLRMLDEAARCLDEGLIAGPADVDLAVILGLGFPPTRTGLLREADRRGLPWTVDRLHALAGPDPIRQARLAPGPFLRALADRKATFY